MSDCDIDARRFLTQLLPDALSSKDALRASFTIFPHPLFAALLPPDDDPLRLGVVVADSSLLLLFFAAA